MSFEVDGLNRFARQSGSEGIAHRAVEAAHGIGGRCA
jgi:hypothetical protein